MSLKTKRRKPFRELSSARLCRRLISKLKKRIAVKRRRLGSGIIGGLMIHPSDEHLIAANVVRDPTFACISLFGIPVYLDHAVPPGRYYLCADYGRREAIQRLFNLVKPRPLTKLFSDL